MSHSWGSRTHPIKCSVFVATSVDGFIAREDGSIDWLNEANGVVPSGEDCGFGEFMSSVDVLIMGRKTFDQVLTFGAWPYGKTRVVVLSRGALEIPRDISTTTSVSSEDPAELLARLSREGAKHAYVDGGMVIQSFLAAGLIDEMTITVIPIVLGAGISLFAPVSLDVHLEHISTRAFDFGFVQHKYRVRR